MNISSAKATSGINARATPTSTGVSGSVQIGENAQTNAFVDANVAYHLAAVIADSTADFVIDTADGDTAGTTAFTAGAAQVETATAAGTITTGGNASVVVTSAGMAGSPITLTVPVALSDTATLWAEKVRTALAAHIVIAARFLVGGTTTAISFTRKPSTSYTVGLAEVPIHIANDSTLNIALSNGTSAGITTAATSANTTAGVATVGVKLFDGDGKDFEGVTIPAIASSGINGVLVSNDPQSAAAASITSAGGGLDMSGLGVASRVLVSSVNGQSADTLTIESTSSSLVAVTVIGKTA